MPICSLYSTGTAGDLEFYVLNVAANDTRNGCVEQLPLNVTIQPVRCKQPTPLNT